MANLEEFAPKVYVQRHPLKLVGCHLGRVVTVLKLASGKTIIHSTAAFSAEDAKAIVEVGKPGWLVEATNFHDTHAHEGRAAFPDVPYLVPVGFKRTETLKAEPLDAPPEEWSDEVDVIPVEGMPRIREHVFYHRRSGTLIVADLFFNLTPAAGRWTMAFMRLVAGIRQFPGMS